MIIRVSQFSSTTRNLVPRFRSGSKGEGIWLRNANGSTQSWLLFLKKLIPFVDVFISLLQVIMMKLSSFLQDLHRTYERIKGGHSERTDPCKVDCLVDNIEEGGGSNSRIETYKNIESKVRRYHGKFRAGMQSFDA